MASNPKSKPFSFKEWYKMYLRSPHMRSVKYFTHERDDWKCVRCGVPHSRKNPLHVHHTKEGYKWLGRELPKHTESLCEVCHMIEHEIEPANDPQFSLDLGEAPP